MRRVVSEWAHLHSYGDKEDGRRRKREGVQLLGECVGRDGGGDPHRQLDKRGDTIGKPHGKAVAARMHARPKPAEYGTDALSRLAGDRIVSLHLPRLFNRGRDVLLAPSCRLQQALWRRRLGFQLHLLGVDTARRYEEAHDGPERQRGGRCNGEGAIAARA